MYISHVCTLFTTRGGRFGEIRVDLIKLYILIRFSAPMIARYRCQISVCIKGRTPTRKLMPLNLEENINSVLKTMSHMQLYIRQNHSKSQQYEVQTKILNTFRH